MFVFFPNLPSLLFDLRLDPKAKTNLIENPKYVSIINKFTQQLLAWRMRHEERKLTGITVTREDIYHRDN